MKTNRATQGIYSIYRKVVAEKVALMSTDLTLKCAINHNHELYARLRKANDDLESFLKASWTQGTSTGRLSGGMPNYGNIPQGSPEAKRVIKAFKE